MILTMLDACYLGIGDRNKAVIDMDYYLYIFMMVAQSQLKSGFNVL